MLRSTCLALLIFAGVAAADVQTGVVRSGGQVIPGATVTAECGTDKITTITDDAGRFEMGGLPSTACKYTVLIFGFEPLQKDAAASATPLGFDLTMQGRASVPVAPGVVPPAPVAAPPAAAAPVAATPAAPVDLGTMPSLTGGRGGQGGGRGGTGGQGGNARGGAPAGGRGGQAGGGRGGFQSLSLTQNRDALGSDSPTIAADAGGASSAGDAFTVNGTLSQGAQAQPGDGFGGPGGFGFGPGGPGGDFAGGGGRGGLGGPGGDGGGRGGGGRGGDGGGGGFAGGGAGGGGGGGFGGPGGGGGFGGRGGAGGGRGGGRGAPGGPAARVLPTASRRSVIAPVVDVVLSGRPASITILQIHSSMRGPIHLRHRQPLP